MTQREMTKTMMKQMKWLKWYYQWHMLRSKLWDSSSHLEILSTLRMVLEWLVILMLVIYRNVLWQINLQLLWCTKNFLDLNYGSQVTHTHICLKWKLERQDSFLQLPVFQSLKHNTIHISKQKYRLQGL